VVALIFLAVSMATNNWLLIQVNRDVINTAINAANNPTQAQQASGLAYYTRRRGLFRECFDSVDTLDGELFKINPSNKGTQVLSALLVQEL